MQSDLATVGGWCFLASVFLMVTGDGLTNINEPVAAGAWPWLYLVPMAVSFVLMAVAGRIDPRRRARAAIVVTPLAALLAAFGLSTLFSQERSLSLMAVSGVTGIAVFWWYAGQVLEDPELLDATWVVVALAVLMLAVRVIVWRLDEGVDLIPVWIPTVTWLGKLQIVWVLNLAAPFLLARFLGDSRRHVSAVNGAAWAAAGLANYLLFSRIGLLIFVVATVAFWAAHATWWRRWVWLAGAALIAGALVAGGTARTTGAVMAGLFNRAQNPGIALRLDAWKESWRMFLAHPATGIGVGTFDEVAFRTDDTKADRGYRGKGWHAHNVPLHILTEAGLPGLAAWVFLWYTVLRALGTAWKNSTGERRLMSGAAVVSVLTFHALSMTEVLIGARVQSSLQMNLTVATLVVGGLRSSLRAPAEPVA